MQRILKSSLLALAFLSIPAVVSAQTLTIEMDATIAAPAAAPVVVSPRGPGPVVIVRPEDDARIARAPQPARADVVVVSTRPAPQPVVHVMPASSDDENIEGWGHVGFFADGVNLGNLDLDFSSPEVQALRGLRVDSGANPELGEVIMGGFSFGFGMRAADYLRGPDLRLQLGGGEIDGPWRSIDGAPAGMEVAVQSVFFLRAELALGLQIPIGPVTPYLVGIGSVGVAFVDVGVRDERLGGLGTETIASGLFGAGLEAGVDVEVEEGLEVGFAIRGNIVGAPSLGGAFRINFGGQ